MPALPYVFFDRVYPFKCKTEGCISRCEENNNTKRCVLDIYVRLEATHKTIYAEDSNVGVFMEGF